VFKWLRSLFSSPATVPPASTPAPPSPAPSRTRAVAKPVSGEPVLRPMDASEIAFLEGLNASPDARPGALTDDDREFLEAFAARLQRHELELPRLPQVAIRLAQMLREGDKPVAEYVKLLNEDPSLSVEVLRTANSALYAAAATTTLQEAVLRIGLSRLQAVLMMGHMKTRILKSGAFQRQAELLLDLAMPIAGLASRFATAGTFADTRFLRGVLMHVEHLVIIGAIADVSREHRAAIHPSVSGIHQAFEHFGAEVRGSVAAAWELTELLTGGEGVAAEYAGFRHAVICRWLGQPLPSLPGIDPARLEEAMSPIAPRVKPAPAALTA
jgi:hypothetical protein